MELIQAAVLGIVQGLTEFLPISSSGHLRIVPALLGWEDPGAAFTAVIQLGTMAAVLLYFRAGPLADRHHLAAVAAGPRAAVRARRSHGLVPRSWRPCRSSIFGVAFADQIETGARDLRLIGTMLIVIGLVLYVADRTGREDARPRVAAHPRRHHASALAQSLALIPGVSRSGATITAGLFRGFTRESAARFSFLLSIPAVVLSGVYELKDIGSGTYGVGPTIVATVLAFVTGYARDRLAAALPGRPLAHGFVVYRVALGILVLVLVAAGTMEPNQPALGDYLGNYLGTVSRDG